MDMSKLELNCLDSGLTEAIEEHIASEILYASRDGENWSWDDDESSCGGADISDPNAEAGSMWCGTLEVPSLEMKIGYGFCVKWTNSGAEVFFGSGSIDADIGDIDCDNGIAYLLDLAGLIDLAEIANNAGDETSTPGLEDAIRARVERSHD